MFEGSAHKFPFRWSRPTYGGERFFRYILIVLCVIGFSLWDITPSYSVNVTLAWDANPPTEEVTGYKVYYKMDTGGPPYYGVDANEGDSPIDVGDRAYFTLTGLVDSETYSFAVTAYNDYAESWYSNEVCINCQTNGGGGGGGCFIATAAY